MRRLILGTAGHIDHGKTALVRALTGVDTDRLPEEKRRGITIDLGFARLPLSGGLELGVVDVPGHEAFVRNMLAGATGFDLALLVIAADEGVMPQTREHLAIIELLGVRAGVVALTKIDLVDDEWLALVLDDVREQLRATSFAGAPVVPVSAVTGAGLDELRQALARVADNVRERAGDDLFRMPVDRVFTVHGTGTVVTGTVWSGAVRREDALLLLPSGLTARARGVQVHGAEVESAGAGQRVAIALAGADRERAARGARGEVLVREAAWQPASAISARIRLIPGTDWELVQRQRVRFHLGTAELLGRVRLLGKERLGPGEAGWARIALEAPAVARAGDRFVIRSYSPVTTIGGGVVYEPDASRRKRLDGEAAALLEQLLDAPEESVRARVTLAGWSGAGLTRLPVETPHPPAAVAESLARLEAAGAVRRVGERVFAAAVVAQARTDLLAAVDAFHARSPLRAGLDLEELRRALDARAADAAPLAEALLEELVQEGVLAVRGHVVARAGFTPRLTEEQAAARDRLAALFETAALAPPAVEELPAELRQRKDFWPLLKLLEAEGRILAITGETFVSARAIAQARTLLLERLAGQGPLGPADFRDVLPVSRKHLIPLLEYFDRCGVTLKKGADRFVPSSADAAGVQQRDRRQGEPAARKSDLYISEA
jgi:selenocysteine-specific elongation factor